MFCVQSHVKRDQRFLGKKPTGFRPVLTTLEAPSLRRPCSFANAWLLPCVKPPRPRRWIWWGQWFFGGDWKKCPVFASWKHPFFLETWFLDGIYIYMYIFLYTYIYIYISRKFKKYTFNRQQLIVCSMETSSLVYTPLNWWKQIPCPNVKQRQVVAISLLGSRYVKIVGSSKSACPCVGISWKRIPCLFVLNSACCT